MGTHLDRRAAKSDVPGVDALHAVRAAIDDVRHIDRLSRQSDPANATTNYQRRIRVRKNVKRSSDCPPLQRRGFFAKARGLYRNIKGQPGAFSNTPDPLRAAEAEFSGYRT